MKTRTGGWAVDRSNDDKIINLASISVVRFFRIGAIT